jgi:hypothetical protein
MPVAGQDYFVVAQVANAPAGTVLSIENTRTSGPLTTVWDPMVYEVNGNQTISVDWWPGFGIFPTIDDVKLKINGQLKALMVINHHGVYPDQYADVQVTYH